MAKYGPEGLSGFELLQAIIGSGGSWGDVLKIAHDVKKLVAQKAVN
jgi:DNA repair protein RadC